MKLSKDASPSISELSSYFKVPVSILQQVYNRGIGAYTDPNTGKVSASVRLKGSFIKGVNAPASMKLSKEQWAKARIYSFLNKGTTYKTTDADLAKKAGY